MRTTCLCIVAMAALAAGPASAAHKGWKEVADVGAAGLMSASLLTVAGEHDGAGARQLVYTVGSTAGVTEALKETVREERPDGSDHRSFPSGHTSISFASAGFLQRRYGWEAGLPATLVAGLVGLARVESKDHHWYDVVAGAALGEASAYWFVKPRDDSVRFMPWADSHGAGFALKARF